MKTEIVKLRIKLADREIELTAQEARDVYVALEALFKMEKSAIEELKELIKDKQPLFPNYPQQPIIINPPITPAQPWQPGFPTCPAQPFPLPNTPWCGDLPLSQLGTVCLNLATAH